MADRNFYRPGATQAITLAISSAQSAAFGAFTTVVRVSTPGVGAWIKFGANPTAAVTDVYLPPNWSEYFIVAPGEKMACIQPTSPSGTVNITEMINS